MKEIKEKLLERIDQLLQKADKVKATHTPNPPNVIGFPTLDEDVFLEWKTNTEQIIVLATGIDSVYHKNFIENVKSGHRSHVDFGIGILRALKEDLNFGYLTNVQNLVIAEIFEDFLSISEYLLVQGYYIPAASLVGGILEDSMRKLCDKNNITYPKETKINSLNTDLAKAGVYNALVAKEIIAKADIRNNADHGHYDKFNKNDVKNMIDWVRRFIIDYL